MRLYQQRGGVSRGSVINGATLSSFHSLLEKRDQKHYDRVEKLVLFILSSSISELALNAKHTFKGWAVLLPNKDLKSKSGLIWYGTVTF